MKSIDYMTFMKNFSFLLVTLFLWGCQEEDTAMPEISPTTEANRVTDGMTVLGGQLENPYSVENMRNALRHFALATRSGNYGGCDSDHALLCEVQAQESARTGSDQTGFHNQLV